MVVVPMTNNKAYEYCKNSINKKTTPKYVKLQMKEFMKICEGQITELASNSFLIG